MAPRRNKEPSVKNVTNKGAWTSEEDNKLAQHVETHGAKRWNTIATKSGLNRRGKSCRLRWMNYLRPNIKRGDFSDQEEDLILRLHKLLGNRWALIAGRLPGRTDNEIKNYWNSHLSKKIHQMENTVVVVVPEAAEPSPTADDKTIKAYQSWDDNEGGLGLPEFDTGNSELTFDVNDFFDFSAEESFDLDWVNKFFELDSDYYTARPSENR